MSKFIKSLTVLGLVAIVGACGSSGGGEEEIVFVEPVAVEPEPMSPGKFK